MVGTVDRLGWTALAPADLEDLVRTYRRTAADLAYAQTHFPGTDVTAYLNGLVARSHGRVYAGRAGSWRRARDFILRGFPVAVSRRRRLIAATAGLFFAAALAGAGLVTRDRQLAVYFLPPPFHDVLEDAPDTAGEGGAGQDAGRDDGRAAFPASPRISSLILVNNVQVAFSAFATGVAAGVGTVYVVAFNGLMLGALTALLGGGASALGFWSLILPHGVIELTAIFIAAAGGLLLGGALVDPGDLPRRDALAQRGKEAVVLLLGTVPLFVTAAAVEGFFTPLPLPPAAKLAFAGLTLASLALYFRRRPSPGDGRAADGPFSPVV